MCQTHTLAYIRWQDSKLNCLGKVCKHNPKCLFGASTDAELTKTVHLYEKGA